MRLDVLTLFPEMFPGYLGESLLAKAISAGLVDIQLHNIRDWTTGKHHKVDDRPYGGGPGMVMMAPPVVDCVEEVQARAETPGKLTKRHVRDPRHWCQKGRITEGKVANQQW